MRSTGGRGQGDARARLAAAIPASVLAQAGDRLEAWAGDITQALCGLGGPGPDTGIRSGGPRYFWHSAASLEWEDEKRDEIHRTNVQGTRNAIEAALHLGCASFFHVSTAYTCGAVSGRIEEDHPLSLALANNAYEASKIEAEQFLRARCASAGLDHVVLRPGIILGTTGNFEPSGSYSGLYGFLRALRKLSSHIPDAAGPVKIHYDPDVRLGWIPVDQCTEEMLRCLVDHENESLASGQAIHLVGALKPESARLGDVMDHILDRMGLAHRFIFLPHPIQDKSPLEATVEEKLSFYATYMRAEKDFQSRLPDRRPVTLEMMRRFIDKEIALADLASR